MEKLTKIWKFFSGKKTVIGGFVVWIAAFPHLVDWIGQEPVDLLYYIGTGLLFGGGVHKIVKKVTK